MKYIALLLCSFAIMGCGKSRGSEYVLRGKIEAVSSFMSIEDVDGCPYVTCKVNNKPFKFLVDTGSTGVLVTPAMVSEGNAEIIENEVVDAGGIGGRIKMKLVKRIEIDLCNGLVMEVGRVGLYENSTHGIIPYKILLSMPLVWDLQGKKIVVQGCR